MLETWKNASKRVKVKTIISIVTDIGAGLLMGAIGRFANYDEKKWKKAVIGVTSFGLSMAVADAASKPLNGMVDSFFDGLERAKSEEVDDEMEDEEDA